MHCIAAGLPVNILGARRPKIVGGRGDGPQTFMRIGVDVGIFQIGRCGRADRDSCARLPPYCRFPIVRYDISCGGRVFEFISSGE